MDSSDIIDLLTIAAVGDKRTMGEADVILWEKVLGHLDKDDCSDAIIAHRRDMPGVWLEPGHIVQRVKAAMKDRNDRSDPDARPIPDKAAPGGEYPAQWSVDERLKATWEATYRSSLTSPPPAPVASGARRQAVAQIRQMLSKSTIPVGDEVHVDVLTVRCPFCSAPVGEPCTCAGMPGRPREVLRRSRAHPSRVEAAAVKQGMAKDAAEAYAEREQVAAVKRYRATLETSQASGV